VPFQTLEGMLSHVITRLEVSRLYDDVDMIDKDIPAVSLLHNYKNVIGGQKLTCTIKFMCILSSICP